MLQIQAVESDGREADEGGQELLLLLMVARGRRMAAGKQEEDGRHQQRRKKTGRRRLGLGLGLGLLLLLEVSERGCWSAAAGLSGRLEQEEEGDRPLDRSLFSRSVRFEATTTVGRRQRAADNPRAQAPARGEGALPRLLHLRPPYVDCLTTEQGRIIRPARPSFRTSLSSQALLLGVGSRPLQLSHA